MFLLLLEAEKENGLPILNIFKKRFFKSKITVYKLAKV